MPRFTDKVVIVTGASSGIGQAIAIRFASEGATLVIDYVGHPEAAQSTLDTITAAGGKGITIAADISKLPESQSLIDQTYAQFGRCDILVNNAGIEKRADFWDVPEADFDAVMNVNFKGAFFLTQFFVRKLRDAKLHGRIINISSVHEDMVFPHFSPYAASKGAMRMWMRTLAVELGPLGITINDIAPGAIATPINANLLNNPQQLSGLLANIPLGRLGNPAEVASLTAWLASDEASYVTGGTYVLDGGLMRSYHEQ